jgi:hypothetical protein
MLTRRAANGQFIAVLNNKRVAGFWKREVLFGVQQSRYSRKSSLGSHPQMSQIFADKE